MLLVLGMILATMPVFAIAENAHAAGISKETSAFAPLTASEEPVAGERTADEAGESDGSVAEPTDTVSEDAEEQTAPLGTEASVFGATGSIKQVITISELQWYMDNAASDLYVRLGGGFDGYYEVGALLTIPDTNPFNITIDLNGYKLMGRKTEYIGTTLSHYGSNAIEHSGSGTLTIVDTAGGGGVEAYEEPFFAICNQGSGDVCIEGGTIKGRNFCEAIFNASSGTVSISGGTVCSESGIAIYNEDGAGKIIISGSPTISGGLTAIRLGGSNATDTVLELTGGTIESPYGTAIANTGSRKVAIPSGTAVIRGEFNAMDIAPELGDVMMATVSTGYSGSPTVAYDSASIKDYKYLKFEPAAAQIGSMRYASLQAAIDAAGQNQTIQLMKDITENVTVSNGNTCSFTLDLNGKTLGGSSSAPVITHLGSGTLTITNGIVESSSSVNGAVLNEGGGTVSIAGGTVKNSGTGYAIASDGLINVSGEAHITSTCDAADRGTIWLYGGVAGDTVLNITGGTIENTADNGYAVYNVGAGKILIPNGTSVIKGRGMAMNVAPDTSAYTKVQVTASTDYDGSLPVAKYSAGSITDYKYLKFEQGYSALINKTAFITLTEAVSAVADGQTITLLDNVWDQITIPSTNSRSFTVDLNGKVWGGAFATFLTHKGSGTLTITDTAGGGKVKGQGGNSPIFLQGGSLVVSGGTVENSQSSTAAILNDGSGSVSVLGGTVQASSAAISNSYTGKITIGGTATVTSTAASASGTIYLSGGTASQTVLEITGGTIENTADNGYAIYNNASGKIVILHDNPAIIRGKGKAMNKAPDLSNYTRLKVTASTNYDGSVPAENYVSGSIGIYKYLKFEQADDTAQIGKNGYSSLSAAVSSVTNGQTIILLKDTAENITIRDVSFTLELNGKTLRSGASSASAITLNDGGMLEITDTVSGGGGKVTSSNNATIALNGGSLVVSGGTVENALEITGAAIKNNGSGSVSVSGGTVEAAYIAIHNGATGSVNVSGGEVKNTGNGMAIANSQTGKITISDTAKITSRTTKSNEGTILLFNGEATDTILEITGGTIENTSTGNAIYNEKNGKIVISSGTLITIRGKGKAMNKAPDLSGFAKVQVAASATYDGSSPVAEYIPANIANYKHLTFEASADTTVSDLNLASKILAPVIGQTPVKSIADDGRFTGTITWSGNPTKFGGDTAYTATVTLTASNGYTFSGLAENVLTHEGATSATHARGYGKTLTMTLVFPATRTLALQSISVTTPPTKDTYKYGEIFNTTGMVVKATYNDGSENANFTIYTVDKTGPLSMADAVITLTANGTSITTTQRITVSKADGPGAPVGLVGVVPTTAGGSDGKITGTTAAMEYADNTDFSGAMNCSETETTGLAAGTYYVCVKATDTHEAGAYATVIIPSPAAPVDKSALDSSITAANTAKDGVAVSVDGSDVDTANKWVTRAAMDALNTAIRNAEAAKDNPSATQDEVNKAAQDLENAISVFNAAKKNGTYTGVDKADLMQVITNANTAKAGVAVSVDGSDVDTANKWVTQTVMNALNTAIRNAEAAKDNPSATQDEVNKAAQDLENAISVFNAAKKNGTYTGVDKADLMQVITNANTAKAGVAVSVDGSDVDTANKWVTQAVMDALNTEITNAETVKDKLSATQDEINEAAQDLENAISVFNVAKKNGTNTGGGTTPPAIEVSAVNVKALNEAKEYITVTAKPGAFSQPAEMKLTDDASAVNAFNMLLGSNKGEILAFDISLYIKGTDTKVQPDAGYAVTIRIPLPRDLWDMRDTITVGHIKDGKVEVLLSSLVWENEMWNIEFETVSFSPYALLVGDGDPSIAVTGVTLNKSKISLVREDSETLIATVMPENTANKSVTWSSSNPSVATVNENGRVTAVAEGKATITATTLDGGYTATCAVMVTRNEIPKTGDSNHIAGWLIALLASVLGILGILVWLKFRKIRGTW